MDWTRGPVLGRGSTATVSAAVDNRSGQVLAVKSAELSQAESLLMEKTILSTLPTSPQVIAYKGSHISSENGHLFYNIFLEHAAGGTLLDAVRKSGGGRLEEAAVRRFSRSILLGLQHIHSSGVVHSDIKSQNILVTGQGAKIADFGCAKLAASDSRRISGTPIYMAPEVARGEQQSFPADVWAFGCTVLEMVTGRPPWPDVSDPVSVVHRIGFSTDVPEIPDFMSKQGRDFLANCLNRNPEQRWSAAELLRHEFVKESDLMQKDVNFSGRESPDCVLEQHIWDSIEGSDFETRNPTRETSPVDERTARERMKELCSDETSWDLLNEDEGENWITVRSNGDVEMVTGNLLRAGSASTSVRSFWADMSEECEPTYVGFSTCENCEGNSFELFKKCYPIIYSSFETQMQTQINSNRLCVPKKQVSCHAIVDTFDHFGSSFHITSRIRTSLLGYTEPNKSTRTW